MKLRVRFGQLRFTVNIQHQNPTLLALKEEICRATSARDVSNIVISLNGKEAIDGDHIPLASHGLVSGDLVYVLSTEEHSLNTADCSSGLGRGADEDVATSALQQVNNRSVQEALHTITNNPTTSRAQANQQALNEGASTSGGVTSSSVPERPQEPERFMATPVFCRDGVSGNLVLLYQSARPQTHHEALLVIIHALMLESGFLASQGTATTDTGDQPSQVTMPVGWKDQKAGTSKFQYTHHLSSTIPCELVISSLGPFMYGHAWSPMINDVNYDIKLVVSQYVKGNVALSDGATAVYQNLHKASRLVKDNLIHPLLATLRHHLGFTSPFTLIGLPAEVQLMIFSQLDARSTLTLSQTCKSLHYISNDQKLWEFFCQRDFGEKETFTGCWKAKYKELYEQRRRSSRLRGGHFVYPGAQPRVGGHFNPFLPNAPPGIIGGSYDIFPDFALGPPQGLHPERPPRNTGLPLRRRQSPRSRFPR